MLASRQVEILFRRSVGRQRGREFGALAQVIGSTAFLVWRKFILSAANYLGAPLLEFAVQEFADFVRGRKKFKTAPKSLGRRTLRTKLGSSSKTTSPSRVFPT